MAVPPNQPDRRIERTAAIRRQTRQISRVLLAAFLAGLSLFFTYRLVLWMRIRAVLGEIRRAGYPTTWEEFKKWHPEPQGGDEYALLLANVLPVRQWYYDWDTIKKREAVPAWFDPFPSSDAARDIGPTSEVEKRELAAWVASNAPLLRQLHRFAGEPERGCWRYDQAPWMRGPPVGGAAGPVDVCRSSKPIALLNAEFLLNVADVQYDRAFDGIITALRYGRRLDDAPCPSIFPAQDSSYGTLESLQQILRAHPFNDRQLQTLMQELRETDPTQRFSVIILWRLLRCAAYRPALIRREDIPTPLGTWVTHYSRRAAGFFVWERLRGLRNARDVLGTSRSALPAPLWAAIRLLPDTWRLWGAATSGIESELVYLRQDILGEATWLAALRVVRVGLAVERYRIAHGRLPDHLRDLVPSCIEALPCDPLTGEPLQYRKTATKCLIYSAGSMLGDEGRDFGPYDPSFEITQ